MELIPNPLVGGALSLGEIGGAVCGGWGWGGPLGSQFTDGWGCDPIWIIVWPGASQTDGWGQIFPKWPPPEKHSLMNIPKSFASKALHPQQATFTPDFPGDPPRTAVRSDSDS